MLKIQLSHCLENDYVLQELIHYDNVTRAHIPLYLTFISLFKFYISHRFDLMFMCIAGTCMVIGRIDHFTEDPYVSLENDPCLTFRTIIST